MTRDGPRRFPPEVELLLGCAREHALDDPSGDVPLAADDLDWEAVADLAHRHRLQPLASRCLGDRGLSVPPDLRTDLEETSNALARRNLYAISQLSDLLDDLRERGVRALAYKGPALAELAYRDVTLREFADLDLLVPEAAFEEAVDVLRANDYEVEASYPSLGEKTLRERGAGIPVDLHSRVTPARHPFAFPFEGLWERRVDVSLSGRAVPTFGPSDHLLVAAVHGTKHFWIQLEWLVSFAALASRAAVDWAYVLRRSRRDGYDRMVLLALAMARDLLGLSPPEGVAPRLEDDWIVRLLADCVASRVIAGNADYARNTRSFHYRRNLTQLLLLRGLRTRGKFGLRLASSFLDRRFGSPDFGHLV